METKEKFAEFSGKSSRRYYYLWSSFSALSLRSLRFAQEVISLDAFMTEHIQFNCV